MALAVPDQLASTSAALIAGERRAGALMDDLRTSMEGDMHTLEPQLQTYLRWYSPSYNKHTGTHDSWRDRIRYEDIDTTRSNFPIARACVDIWAALEAAKAPSVRAEPERVPPPLPVLEPQAAQQAALQYAMERQIVSTNSDIRSARVRKWMRDDQFGLKHHVAVRRKNLYGFSWMKVLPQPWRRRPQTTVLRNPTTVYPLWSWADPGELEAVLSAQKMSARQANARWPQLQLQFGIRDRPDQVTFERGQDAGMYREINDRYYDTSRTMVWVEELWWLEREFDHAGRITSSKVWMGLRVAGRVVQVECFEGWSVIPFVYWENTDERSSYGWSDIAGVIDINDEFNRRISQQGDVIRLYSSPRFQLLGSLEGRDIAMPGPFEMIPLQDTERIEQIIARIDVFPTQAHFDVLTDMLHRVSGLPPIVWGLIANAQTSGRALSASWKATEARLLPKLMRNEQSCRQWLSIVIDQARHYDWYGARRAFRTDDGNLFDDWTWKFPPMEPRDFTEVTMNEITKRDAGFTTTVRGMREIGTDDAEEAWEEVQAEFADINAHPDKVNMRLIAMRAELDNMMMLQQMQGQSGGGAPAPGGAPAGPAIGPGPQAAAPPGMEGPLPPTQQGAPGNAGVPAAPPGGGPDSNLTSGVLVRNGEASAQFLQTQDY